MILRDWLSRRNSPNPNRKLTSEDNVPDEFRDFLWRLTEILEDLDVYKALPEAKGGYL